LRDSRAATESITRGERERSHDFFIEHANAAGRDGAHSQLFLTGRASLRTRNTSRGARSALAIS